VIAQLLLCIAQADREKAYRQKPGKRRAFSFRCTAASDVRSLSCMTIGGEWVLRNAVAQRSRVVSRTS
jgi:hypothetical protein